MRKKLFRVLLPLAVLLLLVSCGARRNPKDVTLLFFKDMRAGKYEHAATCVLESESFDPGRVKEEFESLGGEFLDKIRDFDYEVTHVDEKEESAVVSVKTAYYDLKPLYEEVMRGLLSDIKSDETIRAMNEEEITKEAMNRLNQKVTESTDINRVEKSFNLVTKNTDDKWKLDINNPDLREVVTGNLSNVQGSL